MACFWNQMIQNCLHMKWFMYFIFTCGSAVQAMLVVLMKWEAKSFFFASDPMVMYCNSRYSFPFMDGEDLMCNSGFWECWCCCLMYCCCCEVSGVWCHWLAPVWPGLPAGVLYTPQSLLPLWGALTEGESPFHSNTSDIYDFRNCSMLYYITLFTLCHCVYKRDRMHCWAFLLGLRAISFRNILYIGSSSSFITGSLLRVIKFCTNSFSTPLTITPLLGDSVDWKPM